MHHNMVVVNKSGIYVDRSISDTPDLHKMILTDILSYWRAPVEVDRDITLGDLFDHLQEVTDFYWSMLEDITGCSVRTYLQELNVASIGSNPPEELFISKHQHIHHGTQNDEIFLEEFGYMVGATGDETYNIEFCPLGDLKDSKLVLDQVVCQYTPESNSNDMVVYDTEFTFGEFLTAIFDTLCKYDSPAEREDAHQQWHGASEVTQKLHLVDNLDKN